MAKRYARCIENANNGCAITIGKIYEVRGENGGKTDYFLVGVELSFMKYRFEIVGCPCAITNCVKHRLSL